MPEPHAHEGRGWTAAGYAGLAIYAAVAFSLRNHQTFVDEGSNLNLGWCVRHGLHLYRDVFENHFPLPVYFSAAVIAAVGTSLAKVRLAVFVLDTVMFVWIARATRLVFAVGLSAAVWALISPYYLGNLLLYDNFAMLGALGLGTATFAALTRGLPASRSVCALLAVSSLLAALSSVFFGLSSAIALASLWFAPGMPRRRLLAIVALIAAPVAAYGAYLTASGALGYFYQYTVVFNATTYQRYMTTSLARDAAKQIVLFDVLSPRWREALSPVRFARQTVGAGFDQWIWSGLFYRCAAIAMCVRLGLARRFSAAVFVYLFVASLPLRLDAGFHAAPLVVFCLCLAGLLLQEAAVSGVRWRAIGVAACAVPLAVLAVAGGRYVSLHAFASDFGNLIEEARLMQQAARPIEIFGAQRDHDFAHRRAHQEFTNGVDQNGRAFESHELLAAYARFFAPHARA